MTRRARPRARVVAVGSLALFLAIFALLVFQLRTGRDPTLGGVTAMPAKAAAPPPKRVVIRRVLIVRRVIVHLPAEDEHEVPVAPAAYVPSAPRQTAAAPLAAPAPAPAAPAPVAPAPAPAAAPLTTRSS